MLEMKFNTLEMRIKYLENELKETTCKTIKKAIKLEIKAMKNLNKPKKIKKGWCNQ